MFFQCNLEWFGLFFILHKLFPIILLNPQIHFQYIVFIIMPFNGEFYDIIDWFICVIIHISRI